MKNSVEIMNAVDCIFKKHIKSPYSLQMISSDLAHLQLEHGREEVMNAVIYNHKIAIIRLSHLGEERSHG